MASEQRLRDELNRATESVLIDTSAALARVVATAGRRQRARHAMLAVAAAVLVVVGAVGVSHLEQEHLGKSPGPANRSTGLGPLVRGDQHAASRTVLTGEWQSDAAPAQQVRAAMTASGVSPALVNRTVGKSRRWFVQMTFGQDQTIASLVVQTSDPTSPGTSLETSDIYLYRLLPGHRLIVTPRHPGGRWVFSYRIAGDTLHLQLIRSTPSPSADRTTALFVAWTFAPLTLVH